MLIQEQQMQMRSQEIALELLKTDKSVTFPFTVTFLTVNPSKFVPVFDEHQVTEFFHQFEKVATDYKWPKVSWSSLVQTVLAEKALRAFGYLFFEEGQAYDVLKHAVLRSYEIRPKAYWQRFRNR